MMVYFTQKFQTDTDIILFTWAFGEKYFWKKIVESRSIFFRKLKKIKNFSIGNILLSLFVIKRNVKVF